MIIGQVIGNIWATRKDEKLSGLKFLVVQPLSQNGNKNMPNIVAVDNVGAGVGDTVLIVNGSSARVSLQDKEIPVDATIVGIIDSLEIDESILE